MNRRKFLKTASQCGCLLPFTKGAWMQTVGAREASAERIASRHVPSGNMRDYLSAQAAEITGRALTDIPNAKTWRKLGPEKRRQFFEMMGLDEWIANQRTPPSVTITGIVERETYRIEKLHYESLPGVYITANLYIPRNLKARAPAVLYVCGHARDQKVYYQAHARHFAELGFVCLIAETVEAAELGGFHHGPYREGWWHWYSRGYTPAGIELLNGIRALDFLETRPEVDPTRLGVTGISGGGASSWWIAAGDERVKVTAPVCGTATLFSHVHDLTIDGHCDCMWWINTYRWDLADIAALIAPRPLLVCSANKDGIFTIESIRKVHTQVASLYHKLGVAQNTRLIETPGGHSYHAQSRTAIFSWFRQHLMRPMNLSSNSAGDIDERPEKQESAETLRVFFEQPHPVNRVRSIHDDFFQPPVPPRIADQTSFVRERTRVMDRLRATTFAAFPAHPPSLDLQIEHEFDEDVLGHRFSFTSEKSWRLHGRLLLRKPAGGPTPAVVGLQSPGEARLETRGYLLKLRGPWARVAMELRGTGQTSWGNDQSWHIRRAAAWTGRTVASMRVWDTLRALQAVRRLPEVDPQSVSLSARGEMCAVALYAALLDGNVKRVFLENPPATRDAPGEKDGRGQAIEMLRCLRITDLAQVAGLLWPAELVFIGSTPATYDWAESLHQTLGGPGRPTRIPEITQWKAA